MAIGKRHEAFAILICVLAATGLFAQGLTFPAPVAEQRKPEPAPGSISGSITALGTGVPIGGANVEARRGDCGSTSGDSAIAKTDADGRFRLDKLRPGGWCVGAAHPSGAYTPVEYQQRSYTGRGLAVNLIEGQMLESIDLVMAPTGSISGRVLDDDGEPIARTRVQVMRASYRDGARRLYTMNVVQTNDRGEFHFFWLPPDRYFVAAIPEDTDRPRVAYSVAPPGSGGYRVDALPPVIRRRITRDGELIEEIYAPVYFGGGPEAAKAQPIDIGPAETINAIELTFNGAKTRAWHVRGKVPPSAAPAAALTTDPGRGGPGQQNPPPPPAAQLRLAPRDWTSIVVMPFATTDKDGNFDIAGVAPGSYVLYANVQNQTARIPLEVGNGNVEDIRVVPTPPFRVSGRVIVDNPSALGNATDLRSVRITLAREPELPGVPGVSVSAAVTTESTFSLANVPQGDFRVYVSPLLMPASTPKRAVSKPFENTYVRSIRLGGLDVLRDGLHLTGIPEEGLDIALGLGGGLEGTSTDSAFRPAASATIVLVPDGMPDRFDLYRVTVSDRQGHFQIKGLAPGSYRAFAWDDVTEGAWFDEEFIRAAAARSRSIVIGEGMESTTELVVSH